MVQFTVDSIKSTQFGRRYVRGYQSPRISRYCDFVRRWDVLHGCSISRTTWGDQPGEKLPPLDVGRIIMIIMILIATSQSHICLKLVIVAFWIIGWPFPHSLGVSSGKVAGKVAVSVYFTVVEGWRGMTKTHLGPRDCSRQRRGCVRQRRRGAPGELLYNGRNFL